MTQTLADKAFDLLTDKQKEVWLLVMRNFKTQYEAAKLLGISRDTLKDRLNRAKRKFRAYIKENK